MEILHAMAGTGATEGSGSGIAAFLPFILIFAIIYFFMIRPQSKRQREKQKMHDALKKGDKVVTIGGIHGTIAGLKDKGKLVVLKVDKNVEFTVTRSGIAGLVQNVTDEDTIQAKA